MNCGVLTAYPTALLRIFWQRASMMVRSLEGPSYPVHFVCETTPVILTSGPYAGAVRK